jgi:hypothetical protein
MAVAADRDPLLPVLDQQNGLIDRGWLVAAFQAWTRNVIAALAALLVIAPIGSLLTAARFKSPGIHGIHVRAKDAASWNAIDLQAVGLTPTGLERKPAAMDKSLVAWVSPANFDQQGGSVLTIQSGDRFDAIVIGERARGRWMAGSDFFRRT